MKNLPPVKDSLGRVLRIRWEGIGFFRMQDQRGRNYIISKQRYLEMYYSL